MYTCGIILLNPFSDILSDVHQVLYRQCLYGNAEASPSGGCDTGVSCCQRPVIGCLTSQRCVYHTELNPHTPRVTKEVSEQEWQDYPGGERGVKYSL